MLMRYVWWVSPPPPLPREGKERKGGVCGVAIFSSVTIYCLQKRIMVNPCVVVVVVSQFNGTSTPKVSYSAKTGDNDCNVNSSRYSLRTALCERIDYRRLSFPFTYPKGSHLSPAWTIFNFF